MIWIAGLVLGLACVVYGIYSLMRERKVKDIARSAGL